VKRALPLALATLMLAGCGDGAGSSAKAGSSPGAAKPAGAPPPRTTTGEPGQAAPVTAQGEPDDEMDEEGGEGVNELLGVLDDLPTQDELDAAAAERISEESAEAEYERLKAEIEQDLANPPQDG
jgi:hypothetical protein